MKVSTKEVKAESKTSPEVESSEEGTKSPPPAAEAAKEDVKMAEAEASEPEATKEEPKKKRKQRKSKKVELDEEGNPIQKKKRKLNHQCAAVKICHALMQEYRSSLSEEDQPHLAKFCQLNRGDQGIMFNKMCVAMRGHLKEKYPELQKWEDMDFDDAEKRPGYSKVVNFLLDEYMDALAQSTKKDEEK